MAKWRALHKKISRSGQVNRMSEFAQFLYERAMLHADDWGVMTGDPLEVKAAAIPLSQRTEEEFAAALAEMEEVGLIWRYEPPGWGSLIQFVDFDDDQPQVLIGNRTTPQLPLHFLHPDYPDYPDLAWKQLENTGTSSDSLEDVEKTSRSKSISRSMSKSSLSRSVTAGREKPDTPHHNVVAGYVERIAEGYAKRYPGKFKGDLRAIKQMLGRGHSEAEILACYDAKKADPFWASKHLSMRHVDENIDDWKKAGNGKRRKQADEGLTPEQHAEYFPDS